MQNMPPKPPARPCLHSAAYKDVTFDFDDFAGRQGAFPVQGGEWKTTQSEKNSKKLSEMLADSNAALMSEPWRSRPGAEGHAGGSPESWIAELLWVEQQFPCRR